MAEETLHTAARRVIRFFNIDMNRGGVITVETQAAIETLDRMVHEQTAREQAAERAKAGSPPEL